MNIKIIYEDENLLVLDKPAGITVNKSETTVGDITVQDWVEKWQMNNGQWLVGGDREADFYKRAGIVHRLDKETSGLLIVAKNSESFENLQKQFKERIVKKTYLALAHGKIFPEEGEIRAPVGRLPWNRKRFGILAGGRESITKYKVLSAYVHDKEDLSLVELYPETGRTHQIRVHLKYINRPIFSDYIYAGRKVSKKDRKLLARVFLHAHKISFKNPKTGETISLESPLPEELSNIIKNL
jgi:23S rRNA pseudouridine1911/1915/1917 synthase